MGGMTDHLDDLLLDREMQSFLRKEFGSRYAMRARTLKARYGITTEEALGVIVREQIAERA